MPRTWIYYLALILPLVAHLFVMDTRFFLEWLWYNGYADYYDVLNVLSVNPQMVDLFGGWPLPVFVGTVLCYWIGAEEENIDGQFLLLPLAYLPFLIIGKALVSFSFDSAMLYMYPLVIIPIGYLYIFPWVLFVRVFDKLRLVV
jgi:hypothetical protein